MSQGILGEEQEDDDDEVYTGPLSNNPPVRGDRRKPANKRRREKERKKIEIEAKKKKAELLKENEIYRWVPFVLITLAKEMLFTVILLIARLRSFKAQLVKAEKQSQQIQARRRDNESFRADFCPATIGRYKYEAPDIEVILPNELTGSMRTIIVRKFKSPCPHFII